MTNEKEWRPVVGYEGRYEVSSHGDIRSLPIWVSPNGCKPHIHHGSNRILKQSTSTRGYKTVRLQLGTRSQEKTKYVHRIVCEAFNGPPPEGMPNTLHGDGNQLNNVPYNLSWGTQKMNGEDAIRHGVIKRGAQHVQAKLSDEQVIEIRKLAFSGEFSFIEIAEKFGISKHYVFKIKHRISRGDC